MKQLSISVVIPCFNEKERIERNIVLINNYLRNNFENYEIIVVDDGSNDGTREKLIKIKNTLNKVKIVFFQQNHGKGFAVTNGMKLAEKEIVLFLDADLAIPIEELPKFIDEINKGMEVAIASRFISGAELISPILFHRKVMEQVFRLIRKIIIGLETIEDTQCGFKVFRKEAAKKIFSKVTIQRFSFDAEILYLAKKYGYRIKEVPIRLHNPLKSHIRLIFDPINMFFGLLKIRLNNLLGNYDV